MIRIRICTLSRKFNFDLYSPVFLFRTTSIDLKCCRCYTESNQSVHLVHQLERTEIPWFLSCKIGGHGGHSGQRRKRMTTNSTDSKKNRLCSAWERRDLPIDSSFNKLKNTSGMSRTVICTAMERLEPGKKFSDPNSLYCKVRTGRLSKQVIRTTTRRPLPCSGRSRNWCVP